MSANNNSDDNKNQVFFLSFFFLKKGGNWGNVSAALRACAFPLKVSCVKLRVIYCGQIKPYCRGRVAN